MHILMYPWTKNIPQGAGTTIFAAIDEDLGKEGGKWVEDCKVQPMYPEATVELQKQVWADAVKVTGLDYPALTN